MQGATVKLVSRTHIPDILLADFTNWDVQLGIHTGSVCVVGD